MITGDASCTHTDSSPAWWQVDLGTPAHVVNVRVYHRTDCCQDRLEGANVIVSTSPDFAATGSQCAPLSDHTQVPEESTCDLTGQFVTVSNPG